MSSIPLSAERAEIVRLHDAIREAKAILITGTADPDGDSIGSQLALYELFKEYNSVHDKAIEVDIVNETVCPPKYCFLQDSDKILTPESAGFKRYDLGFVCDGGLERAGSVQALFDRVKQTVLFDHHKVGSKLEYAFNFNYPECSSTCELAFDLIESGIFGVRLNVAMAEALYLGIIFDTGFFKHSITTPKTYRIGARLVETGFNFSRIARLGMLERSPASIRLLARTLERFEQRLEGRFAVAVITQEMLKATGAHPGDNEGNIDYIFNTPGTEVACIFYELPGAETRLSFRSIGNVDVAAFARSLTPEGGGHVRAAGCHLKGELSSVMELVTKKLAPLLPAR